MLSHCCKKKPNKIIFHVATNAVTKTSQMIDWENLIRNAHVDCMTKLFSDLFLQIVSLNISNKIIICNDNDAPWVTSEVKTAIKRNTRVHRKWVFRDRNSD